MLVEMTVHAIVVDQGDHHIVVLRDATHTKALPIVVGQFEAKAIDYELRRRQPPRPQTHDLLRNVLVEVGAVVRRVAVTDLRDQTYYAVVYVERSGRLFEIDARPSDAIALALRCRAPIFVAETVIEYVEAAARAGGEGEASAEIDRRFEELIADAGLEEAD